MDYIILQIITYSHILCGICVDPRLVYITPQVNKSDFDA
jgi:hypothetical protein